MYVMKCILAIILAVFSAHAELKLAALFSDGMVFQREQEVPVWGWAEPGAQVKVSYAGKSKTTRAGKNGKFLLRLDKMKASANPETLRVSSGDESIEVKNVLAGEVWLCSGQSNMQWPVSRSKDFEQERRTAGYPGIRMFLTDLTANIEPQQDCTGTWKVCSPDTVGAFSATAYFFGRVLHRELKVPIGLIRSCWGGTRIEAWSPMPSLKKYPDTMILKAEEDRRVAMYNEAREKERHTKRLKEWRIKVEKAGKAGKKVPRRPAMITHPHKNPNYPANLYNSMIHPLIPYGMRGAIWYQGESNTKTINLAVLYRDMLENMVFQWRRAWGEEFPFYAVQLVNYLPVQPHPVQDTAWPRIRESFLKFHKEVPNAGIAVGIDVGEADDIHPKNKQAVGQRLAQQALAKTYKKKVAAGGPIYKSMRKDGSRIIVHFEDTGSGLAVKGGGPLKWFAIAGADRRFIEAQAAIVGDTVVVRSEQITDPSAVRYAWANNPAGCNLANKEGFPASPFRTDNWPVEAQP